MTDDDRPQTGSAPDSARADAHDAPGDDVLLAADEAPENAGVAERLTRQMAAQWALIRAERAEERRAEVPPIRAGASNFSRAQVPWGLDLAAAWSWRLLVIGAAGLAILWLLAKFAVVTFSLAIALLLAALVVPLVDALARRGIPRGPSSLLGVLLTFGAVGGLLTFAGQQVANGVTDLADQVVTGLGKIRTWLTDGPLNASESQINDYIKQVQEAIATWSKSDALNQVTDIGAAIGHVTAGFFIVLFAMYFFMSDGARIWSWTVRLSPRAARTHVDSSGRVAWVTLTQYVRATVLVALVDAIGVVLVAWLLDVPFILAIGVLVFLGAFVPMIGATVAGAVAVLVALVDQGPVTALLMLLGVIVVQQIEGNVLQPFLMGRFVAIHPLGIILAIAMGLLVAGIGGVLIVVPLVAALNAVVLHLSENLSIEEVERTEHEQRALDDGVSGLG